MALADPAVSVNGLGKGLLQVTTTEIGCVCS